MSIILQSVLQSELSVSFSPTVN